MLGIIIACSSHTPMTEIFKLHLMQFIMQFIIHINSLLLTHISLLDVQYAHTPVQHTGYLRHKNTSLYVQKRTNNYSKTCQQ